MTGSGGMRVVFFDFVIHFGGAQQSTALLCNGLRATDDVQVIDAFGACELYSQTLQQSGVPFHVLLPGITRGYIGSQGRPLRRAVAIASKLGLHYKLRSCLARTVRQIDPDLIWTNTPK